MSPQSDIYAALAAAKAAMPDLVKDSRNDHFGNTFLSLNGLLAAVIPVLLDHGIDVVQVMDHVGDQPALRTQLRHDASGTLIEGVCPMMLAKVSPQDVGSATTYLRRYALTTTLNLLAEDDDGNASSLAARIVPKGAPTTPGATFVQQPWE